MSKGFSINGWVFLLALLSLFAGFYILGGIKGRNEVRSLDLELQMTQGDLCRHQGILEEQDAVIIQLNSALDLSITQSEQCEDRYREALKRETALRNELEDARNTKCDTIIIMPYF